MTKQYPISEHFDGKRFYNLDKAANVHKTFFELLKWQFTKNRTPWPEWVEDNQKPNLPAMIKPNEVLITYINHATELIQFHNWTLLTDPVFSQRVSPFPWLGPKRVRAPGLEISQLPKIDVVIISHNHYDHLDIASLVTLHKNHDPIYIVPLGNAKLLKSKHIQRVIELDWWQDYSIGKNQKITLVPAQHWSGRAIIDTFHTLWGGYIIQSEDLTLYFAGDTGYGAHFKQIAERFKSIDISMLPIGSYEPQWFMKEQHVNPQEAVSAHLDLGSKLALSMHFGSFQLTDEGIEAPVIALTAALKAASLPEEVFLTPKNGQTIPYIKN